MSRRIPVGSMVSLGMGMLLAAAWAAPPAATISKARAMRQAAAFTGFPQQAVASATQCIVTDPTAVVAIRERPVWEVTFEGVNLSVPGPKGTTQTNPTLHTVIVWINARDGALVRLFTPPPKASVTPAGRWRPDPPTVTGAESSPARSFTAALAAAAKVIPVTQAKEITGYYGRAAVGQQDRRKPDRPVWLLLFRGVSLPVPDGDPYVAAAVAVEATSGQIAAESFAWPAEKGKSIP